MVLGVKAMACIQQVVLEYWQVHANPAAFYVNL
jgi:hypothetical protein